MTEENKLIRPKKGESYTAEEIETKLYLRDMPHYGFEYNGIPGVIQNSHLMPEDLLSVPGMKESRWVYVRETFEWIPVFRFDNKADQPSVDTFLDLEPYDDKYLLENEEHWWATPKGFPRKQNE